MEIDQSSDNSNPQIPDPSRGNRLLGQTILVTRPAESARSFCERLEKLGARTIAHPVIHVEPAPPGPIDDAISRIAMFDWVVLVSPNGVQSFVDRVLASAGTLDLLTTKKFATIGPSTFAKLQQSTDIESQLTPADSDSDSLAEALIKSASGQRVLLIRANRGSAVLGNRLKQAGIEFEEVVAYQSVDVDTADPVVAEQLRTNQIDWVTMTSSAIARSTIRLFGDELRNAKTASISPTTSAAMIELGFQPDVEARQYDMEGLIDSISEQIAPG